MAEALRIVFMGSPDFAVPALRSLIDSRHRVVAVVTGSDKRRGRGTALTPTPVKAVALEAGIPVLEADSLKDGALAGPLRALNPDLFVVVAFKILPPALLAVPRIGSVNLHASLLPKYRGAAPIHHAIAAGETETGLTVFLLNEGIDTGGILLRERTPIGPAETTGDLYARLMTMGGPLAVRAADGLADGTLVPEPQDDRQATPAPKLFPEDALLDLRLPATDLVNRIRAFNPHPGAWLRLDGLKWRIHAAVAHPAEPERPTDLRTGAGTLRLTEVQLEGRTRQSATDFLNGYGGAWKIEDKSSYI